MRARNEKDLAGSVMLCPARQTSWVKVMENLHDKSPNLPDPDIFAFHISEIFTMSRPSACRGERDKEDDVVPC